MARPSLKSLFLSLSYNALVLLPYLSLSSSAIASASPTSSLPSESDLHVKRSTGKYFNEPGGSLARSHYDIRFFKEEIPYEEHRTVLRNLIRSYLVTMRELSAETWIAHGTLLGWWWNGKIMPWDYDLDVQVSNATMYWLASNLNRTEHTLPAVTGDYDMDSDPAAANRTYLLDISPHHADIKDADGLNIIDARWIDVQNGMFIDITVLREREQHKPGTWSCKNWHRYATHDLWPMRITEFEGVEARVPYSFEKILTSEYGTKSLVVEEHEHHRWDRNIQEWVKMSDEDQEKSRAKATERKKQELRKQGRL